MSSKKEFVENFLRHPGINASHFARVTNMKPTTLGGRLDRLSGLYDWQVEELGDAILDFLDEVNITEGCEDNQ